MKEDKSIFLKVDSVEPVYKAWPSSYDYSRVSGIKVWINGDGHIFECDQYTVCDPDIVREDGRRQVVALMNELVTMMMADNKKLFGYATASDILTHFSYDEIVEKLDNWKKAKETIRVRDEVVNIRTDCKMVVTVPPKMNSNSVEYMSGISKDGKVYKDVVTDSYKKTGLHVDDLDSYLEV